MDLISGASWRDRQFFRVRVSDCLNYSPNRTREPFRIAECELAAAVFAILMWSKVNGAIRHTDLCADDQNVFYRVSKSEAKLAPPIGSLGDWLTI